MKILVVEDSMPFVLTLRVLLKDLSSVKIVSVTTLREALEKMSHTSFDAILLDLQLPDSDLEATAERIPEITEKARGARVILMSGYELSERVESQATTFLHKGDGSFVEKLIESLS